MTHICMIVRIRLQEYDDTVYDYMYMMTVYDVTVYESVYDLSAYDDSVYDSI